MTTTLLMQLITISALIEGIKPETALTIAQIESSMRMDVTGPAGEVGIMQVLPSSSKYSVKELRNPLINIKEGLRILKEAKNTCKHQLNETWTICYNLGVFGGSKIRYPEKFKYYKKFVMTKEQMKKKLKRKEIKYASFSREPHV